jgi:hypothetical protein
MMFRPVTVAALLVTAAVTSPDQSPAKIVGTWQLVSRIDRDSTTGQILGETTLGAAPIGYLIYDAAGHVAAQLSARDRPSLVCDSSGSSPDPNNNANIGGYSAYFGRYQVDAGAGTVTHVLEGALAPADAGKRLRRRFHIVGDTLTIQFELLVSEGNPRTRTLIWQRVSR